MIVFGYGDLVVKIFGGVDWIIVDVVGIELFDQYVWVFVQSGVWDVLLCFDDLCCGDLEVFFGFVEGFILLGLVMQVYDGICLVFGVEYYFSYIWELVYVGVDCNLLLFYGYKVVIGIFVMFVFYEKFFD